ncbi:2-methoxy-6-polyprenyl-1,4-benzoquinol methylase, mitochondrial, partial [Fragariocoptes setiger]
MPDDGHWPNGSHQSSEDRSRDPSSVHAVFSSVSSKYDLMNDLMSFYIHRCWKKHFIDRLNPMRGTRLLDVAGGTGDIAFRFLERTRSLGDIDSSVIICDINEKMLEKGQMRGKQELIEADLKRLDWTLGDAQDLPFADESFEAYTIAYGIRNVYDRDQALREAYRVLKPGGVFMCLEFSQASPLIKEPYEKYLTEVIPILGEVVVGDYKSYEYLANSILGFPSQEEFRQMISDAGFKQTSYENLLQGISAIHYGYKPHQ